MKDSIDLINNIKVMNAHDAKTDAGLSFLINLYNHNKKTMLEKLGRQTKTFTGTRRVWIWEYPFEGHTFYIMCSKRGTSYEVEYPAGVTAFSTDDKIGNVCIRFLSHIVEEVLNNGRP